jgi:hypothetical protein
MPVRNLGSRSQFMSLSLSLVTGLGKQEEWAQITGSF